MTTFLLGVGVGILLYKLGQGFITNMQEQLDL